MALDHWKELGADGVIVGTIGADRAATSSRCACCRWRAGASRSAKQYTGSLNSVKDGGRVYAHTASDEIHQQQRALRGVARTKLAFSSDRDGERMKGPVADRGISNIYMSDYDGANQTRITVHCVARHHAGVGAGRKPIALHVVAQRLSRTSSCSR